MRVEDARTSYHLGERFRRFIPALRIPAGEPTSIVDKLLGIVNFLLARVKCSEFYETLQHDFALGKIGDCSSPFALRVGELRVKSRPRIRVWGIAPAGKGEGSGGTCRSREVF